MRNRTVVVLFVVVFLFGVSSATSPDEKLDRFVDWAKAANITWNFNIVHYGDGQGYGGEALKDIEPGERYSWTPKNWTIDSEMCEKQLYFINFPKVIREEALLVWLILETTSNSSKWGPYLDLLPVDFSSTPLLWEDDVWEYCEGTILKRMVMNARENINESFRQLEIEINKNHPYLFRPNVFTREAYYWAYLIAHSRAWGSTKENDLVLVPMADILNHEPMTGVGSMGEDGFNLFAWKEKKTGDQVTISYGGKSSLELLHTYGFILDENLHENLLLSFALSPETNLAHSKIEPILKQYNSDYRNLRIYQDGSPTEILKTLRLSEMKFSELGRVGKVLEGKRVSLQNEWIALRTVMNALRAHMRSFTSTVDEAQKLLDSGTLTMNQRNALQMRLNVQKIVRKAMLEIRKLWEGILLNGFSLD